MKKTMVLMLLLLVMAIPESVFAVGTQEKKEPAPAAKKINESPMLAELVAEGKLPPLGERLPEEPLVIEPVDEIGQYGRTLEYFYGVNRPANEVSFVCNEAIIRWAPSGKKFIPNVCRSYEISPDGRSFTFYMRKGHRWSDGTPFTTEDMMFHWEDILLNKDLSPSLANTYKSGDETVKVEALDDYTIRFTFAQPSGLFLEAMAHYYGEFWAPKHYLKQFHQKYANQETLEKMVKEGGFESWMQLFRNKNDWYINTNPDLPILRAWKLVTTPPASRYVCERNPFYFKVDPEGNQLPYIDRWAINPGVAEEVVDLKSITGENSLNWRSVSLTNYTLYKENEEKGDYRVLLWDTSAVASLALYPNYNCSDPVIGPLMENKDFRIALSIAINRDLINKLVYQGMGKPWHGPVKPESAYFLKKYENVPNQYDPDGANAILDELGIKWSADKKYRLRPDGKFFVLVIEGYLQTQEETDVYEIIKQDWETVGIKTKWKVTDLTTWRARVRSGDAHISLIAGHDGIYDYSLVMTVPTGTTCYWAPMYGEWYRTKGVERENPIKEPPDELKRLMAIRDELLITPDIDKKIELFQKIFDYHLEFVPTFGIVGDVSKPIAVKNNLRNIPEKGGWYPIIGNTMGRYQPEQWFFKQQK